MSSEQFKKYPMQFKGQTVFVCQAKYQKDGSVALPIMYEDPDMNNELDQFMMASSWIPGLKSGEIAIKTYSENQGIYQALVEADIIEEAHAFRASGLVDFPIVRLKKGIELPVLK